jgi:hypothetical protein
MGAGAAAPTAGRAPGSMADVCHLEVVGEARAGTARLRQA